MKQDKRKLLPIDKIVAENILRLRLEKKITQHFIAEKLDISFQQFQKYEKGMNRISVARLHAISIVFNTPVEYFFKESELKD